MRTSLENAAFEEVPGPTDHAVHGHFSDSNHRSQWMREHADDGVTTQADRDHSTFLATVSNLLPFSRELRPVTRDYDAFLGVDPV
jgi:hypothetical protein